MSPSRIINTLARSAFPGSLWCKESWLQKSKLNNSRIHVQKRGIIIEWIDRRIPNLCCPVIIIERKIMQQSINEAELSDSFGVQVTEYVKPDFVWEFCCHRLSGLQCRGLFTAIRKRGTQDKVEREGKGKCQHVTRSLLTLCK